MENREYESFILSMNNSNRCEHEDRLSRLPNSVIFKIFWLLPMTDVVRTSLLSKRWRNLWTFSPFLSFGNRAKRYRNEAALRKFINRALLCWNGDRVLKFKFDSCEQLDCAIYSDIDLWVSFAMRNGVEELDLLLPYDNSSARDDFYVVPQCLYSCSSLKKLTLKDCNLEIFGNVQWNQLESLKIESFRVTAHVINQILSGSPQLRVFNLRFAHRNENLSIQSSSLKELSIHKFFYKYLDINLSTVLELGIWTPNLETLEITGIPFCKCSLMDVSSVTNATIGLSGVPHYDGDALFSGNTLSQILPTIQHAENVTLLHCCTKVLGVMKMKCMHSSFPNVKSLEIGCCFNDHEQVVGLLAIFPQLERLVLKDNDTDNHLDDQEWLKFEANLPESFLLQLRTIEVTWLHSNSMFPLIEILLKYASKLERMVFQVKKSERVFAPPPIPFVLVSQKLEIMPRSSPSCKIDFYDCTSTGE